MLFTELTDRGLAVVLDVEALRHDFTPPSIIEVLSKELAEPLIRGFLRQTGWGMAYAFRDPVTNRWRFEGDNEATLQNTVCQKYAELTAKDDRPRCRKSDEKECDFCAQNPSIARDGHDYLCWLGFREDIYSLEIDEGAVAFIITGQQIPNDPGAEDRIRTNIQEKLTGEPELRDSLLKMLPGEVERQRKLRVPPDEFHKDVLAFRNIVQNLIDRLITARRAAASSQLLAGTGGHVASIATLAEPDWVAKVLLLLEDFCKVANLHRMLLLERAQSHYRVAAEYPIRNTTEVPSVRARHVLNITRHGELVCEPKFSVGTAKSLPISTGATLVRDLYYQEQKLRGSLQLGEHPLALFRYDSELASESFSSSGALSTLLVLVGTPSHALEKALPDFCRMVSFALAARVLTRRVQEAQREYMDWVRLLAHSMRTPLQLLSLTLEAGLRKSQLPEELEKQLRECQGRVGEIREDIAHLLLRKPIRREVFDIAELLEEVVQSMMPLAAARSCTITRPLTWMTPAWVNADDVMVEKAIVNVLDNAVKYSLCEREVRVTLRQQGEEVRILISNLGPPMPRELIEDLLNQQPRRGPAAVALGRARSQDGTGSGVVTTVQALRALGGHLEIDSRSRGSAKVGMGQERGLWHTQVTLVLPIVPDPSN
jgi:signal transduction histidine kinase